MRTYVDAVVANFFTLNIDNIDDGMVVMDQPKSAPTQVKEASELLLLESAAHINMVMAQRALYQAHVGARFTHIHICGQLRPKHGAANL